MPSLNKRSLNWPARIMAVALLGAVVTGTARANPPADPVVATVNGQAIHLSEVKALANTLPPQARNMPEQQLYPMLLEQLIDTRALLLEARKQDLDQDPAVKRAMQLAADRALEGALLRKVVAPKLSEAALKTLYKKEYAGKPGVEEVHARHILVDNEATAKKIIAELKKGADFAKLAKKYSKDPNGASQGGDLGFFKKSDMVPAFADAAFALKDNEISPTPVKTQFGWHVIQTLQHRTAPPPKFADVENELRHQVLQAAVQKAVTDARAAAKVQTFNMDGSPIKATDGATPPPASK